MVAKACVWVRRHPDRWEALRGFCARLAAEGEPIQRGTVYEQARRHGMDVRLASMFKRDHNLWSVLSRYMAMEDPSLTRFLRFRETPVDEVDLVGYWEDIVGPQSFRARSLAEARRLAREAHAA